MGTLTETLNVLATNLQNIRKTGNLASLRIVAGILRRGFGVTLRIGSRDLHEANPNQIREALQEHNLAAISLYAMLDEIAKWGKTSGLREENGFVFDVQDLLAIQNRHIKLSRDLHQVAQMQDLLEVLEIAEEDQIIFTLNDKALTDYPGNPAGRAALLADLRSFCGVYSKGIHSFTIDSIRSGIEEFYNGGPRPGKYSIWTLMM